MVDWYYSQGGQQFGPVAIDVLQRLAQAGTLRPSDLVWNASLPNWTEAGRVPQLFSFTQPPQPMAAAPPAVMAAPMVNYMGPDTGVPPFSGRAMDLLRQTKPWARFMAVMAFIGAGLMIVAGIVFMADTRSLPRNLRGMGAVAGLIYMGMGALYLVPGIYLNQYANHIAAMLTMRRTIDLESALAAQKSFWKYVGILTIVMLSLVALSVLMAVANVR